MPMPEKINESASQDMPADLAGYDQTLEALVATIDDLPAGTLADSYHQALQKALALLAPKRAETARLFAAALPDDSRFELLRGWRAERLALAYQRMALRADDGLREAQARDMGIALYAIHVAIVLFWLYDRSPGQAATKALLQLAREHLKLLRALFILPVAPKGIAKLAAIILPTLAQGSQSAAAQDDARGWSASRFRCPSRLTNSRCSTYPSRTSRRRAHCCARAPATSQSCPA